MDRLLIDIGNTRIKKALYKNQDLKNIRKLFYDKNNFITEFDNLIKPSLKSLKDVYISNLNKTYEKSIKIHSKFVNPGVNFHFLNLDMQLPFKINYAKTLGIDRVCTMAGAINLTGKKNILLIDSGTATTVNLLINNVYEGGMITAGLQTVFKSLELNTTLPNVKKISKLKPVNKNTNDAIISGVYYQQIFFINSVISYFKSRYKNLTVAGTGGGLNLFKKEIRGLNFYNENMVLYGMNYIAELNENNK